MHFLEIATAQASLGNHLGPLRAQPIFHCKVLSTPFNFGDDKRLLSVSKSFQFPNKVNSHERSKLLIKAVATFEPRFILQKADGHNSYDEPQLYVNSDSSTVQLKSFSEDLVELDEREKLRRMRISKANKGNTPWNKGRKHSAETLKRIRERTRLAMQNPKVKMKLANLGHAQSKETRKKIGVGVRMGWRKRRQKQMVQETCYFEWQNLIAEASRRGYADEEELQWDSYKVLSKKLEADWVQSIEERRTMPRPKGSKRAPKSPEQRRKIAEAIAAKWADPVYRERVCSGLAKYHGTPVETERKQRRKPSSGTESPKREPRKKKTSDTSNSLGSDTSQIQQIKLRRSKTPVYKDPLASSKLEMIKSIRVQRVANETKKTEAIDRARLLIAEAEKAAKALEVAALKSPIARASLLETRKLIAEAVKSIESIDTVHNMSDENDRLASLGPAGRGVKFEKETKMTNKGSNQAELREVNGTKMLATSTDEDLKFFNYTFHDMLNGEEKCLLSTSSGENGLSSSTLESLFQQPSLEKRLAELEPNEKLSSDKNSDALHNKSRVQPKIEVISSKSTTPTKKWVRGRLVETTKEG